MRFFFDKLSSVFVCRLNRLVLEFNINAIQLKDNDLFSLPDCYHFLVKVNSIRWNDNHLFDTVGCVR